jgi:hypothetical protein
MRSPGQPRGTQVFDDFEFQDDTVIKGLTWRGAYCSLEILQQPPAPVAHAFAIAVHPSRGDEADRDAPLWSQTFPVLSTGQTLVGQQMARCGKDERTAYGFHNYTVKFDKPFAATRGVRYWMAVQAQVSNPLDLSRIVYWGWGSGMPVNRRSLMVSPRGDVTVLATDRDFTFIR